MQRPTLTFRQYLEGNRMTDASALDVFANEAGDVADARSWPQALAALKRFRCSKDRIWTVRFLWQDYERVLSKLD